MEMPDLLPDTLSTDDLGLYIYANMPDGTRNMIFDIRVRGWGNLTGGGARNLNEADAIKVQKMWADEMCNRWNTRADNAILKAKDAEIAELKKAYKLQDDKFRVLMNAYSDIIRNTCSACKRKKVRNENGNA